MFVTISELEETTVLKDDDVFAISTLNGSIEHTKKIKFSNLMGGMSELVAEATESLNGLAFGTDSNGNWGYIKPGADTVTPFKSQADIDDAYRRGRDDGITEGSGIGGDEAEAYAMGYASGQQSVKTAHKLTIPAVRNTNYTVTGEWYTSVDTVACYDAGVASVKTAHKLTVPSARNANAAITAQWYTSVDNTACYDTGYNTGKTAGANDANSKVTKTSASYKQGLKDSIGGLGTGKLHQVGTGASYTVTVEGTYLGVATDVRPNVIYDGGWANLAFSKNGTNCQIGVGSGYKDYLSGGDPNNASYTYSWGAGIFLEYCAVGDKLQCSTSNAKWYRIY